jgi:hypothetical protein
MYFTEGRNLFQAVSNNGNDFSPLDCFLICVRHSAFDVWRSVRKIRSDFGFIITRAKTGSRRAIHD